MENIDASLLLRRTFEIARLVPVSALIAWLAMALPMTAFSVMPGSSPQFSFFGGLIATFAQFVLTSRALRRAGLMRAEGAAGRAGSYVLFCIVSGLAIMLGILFLILPGLYLLARWSIGVPLVVAEGATMGEAMQRSWERTRGLGVPICLAFVVIGSGLVVSGLMDAYFVPDYGSAPFLPALASNLIGFGSNLLSWFLALAIYGLTVREHVPDLEQVFA